MLRWKEKKRILPIWVALTEAIVQHQREAGVPPRRPRLTDLLIEVVSRIGSGLKEVQITSYFEGDYVASLVTNEGEEFDCRPSDAIAVAYILDLPIFADEAVLSQASIYISEMDLEQWLDLHFESDVSEPLVEDSASGDAAADADFSRMMKSMGVSEADLIGENGPETEEK